MLCCWNCYCKCERDPTEESPKRWCALRCNVHWILSLLRTTYLYSCRKWSNLEPVIGCGAGGQKLTNSHKKKSRAGGSGWSPGVPTVRLPYKHPWCRRRWWCCRVTIPPPQTPRAHISTPKQGVLFQRLQQAQELSDVCSMLILAGPCWPSVWGAYQAIRRWSVSPHGRLQHFYFCKDKETNHTRWQWWHYSLIILRHLLPWQNRAGILRQ